MNTYEAILNMYVSNDALREWMRKPFSIYEHAMATDAYSIVWFEKSLAPNTQPLEYKSPEEIMKVIPSERNEQMTISIETIKDAINKCPLLDDYDIIGGYGKCECCRGEGTVEYEFQYNIKTYYHEYDCPICEGAGTSTKEIKRANGKKVLDQYKNIQIGNAVFSVFNIDRLLKTAELLGVNEVTLTLQIDDKSSSIFTVGNVEVLIMPMMFTSDISETIIYKISKAA